MKINAFISRTALAAVAACALTAGLAVAQTAAPAPASSTSAASAPAKPRPHRDGQPGGGQPGGHFAPHPPTFEELDTNHDGMVSKAEFDAWRAAHPMPGHPGDGQGPGKDEGMHGGMHQGWGGFEMHRQMMWMRMHEMERRHGHGRGGFGHHVDFDKVDTDHDGKISLAEFQAAAAAHLKERFDKLDANHDGFIEKDELKGHGDHGWHHDGKDHRGDTSGADASAAAPAK
jgi:hypothetical protein